MLVGVHYHLFTSSSWMVQSFAHRLCQLLFDRRSQSVGLWLDIVFVFMFAPDSHQYPILITWLHHNHQRFCVCADGVLCNQMFFICVHDVRAQRAMIPREVSAACLSYCSRVCRSSRNNIHLMRHDVDASHHITTCVSSKLKPCNPALRIDHINLTAVLVQS